MDEESTLQLLYSPKEVLSKKVITKPEVGSIMEHGHDAIIEDLRKSNRYHSYGDCVDVRVNNNAPFIVIRW